MEKKIIISITVFSFLLACGLGGFYLLKDINMKNVADLGNDNNPEYNISWENNGDINILTSIDDEIIDNSMRCGTFQLVWNDMINEVVKQDVIFTPQLKIVENLNKQSFTNKELSPNSYYSKFGLLTLDLKDEIEKGIKEKFDENSDILDQLDWAKVPQSDDYYEGKNKKEYLFYTILKKIFEFEYIFNELDNGKFADKYEDIKYFGIDGNSDSSLYDQVYVYYYDSEEDFAVALKTKEGDDVILARGIRGDSFKDVYDNILNNRAKYEGNHNFTSFDYLKVPELKFKNLTEFYELENKGFYTKNGDICQIIKALQSIQLNLDKKGGEIKSEALIEVGYETAILDDFLIDPVEIEHRYFYFDQPYVMFLKEENKDLPYFAAQISDITLFQK